MKKRLVPFKGIVGVICLLLPLHLCASHFLVQNTKISFDEENYLVFEDVGRTGEDDSFSAGRFVRLHVTHNGESSQIDLVDQSYEPRDPRRKLIPPQVKSITYMNKDKVWITSRAGHRGDKAILFNLLTKSPERTYTGVGFTLSPDTQHIAYGVPAGSSGKGQEKVYDSKVAVFIDDIMIYPIIKSGFVINKTFGIPAREDGTTFFHFIKDKETPTSRLNNIQWLDTGSLRFILHENWVESIQKKDTSLQKSVNYEVSNVFHDESSTTTITVKRIDPVH